MPEKELMNILALIKEALELTEVSHPAWMKMEVARIRIEAQMQANRIIEDMGFGQSDIDLFFVQRKEGAA